MKKNVTMVRLSARVTLADWQRLDAIRRRYGFRSLYQILNYLVYCFLRVADREHDSVQEPLPDEIEHMFEDYSTPGQPVKYKKARPHKSPVDL